MFGMGTICLAGAVQAKAPNLRRSAEQIADINCVGGRFHELNYRFAGRNDHRCIRELRFIQGTRKIFPRGASARESR